MFDKLKEKLNDFKKTIDDKVKSVTQAEKEQKPETAPETRAQEAPQAAAPAQAPARAKETAPAGAKQPSGIFDKAVALTRGELILSEKELEGPLWDLEMALLESDVALPVAESIIETVKKDMTGQRKKLLSSTGDMTEDALRHAISDILNVNTLDFDEFVRNREKPVTIIFIGVNGAGKTTTIAKLGQYLKDHNYSVAIAAGDTFRAGAIEQLERHAEKLGIKMIKHQQGADPAAVIYDAVAYAKSNKKDIVLADTAGRLHTNINLMDQLRKISRVVKPDLVIFVDEAIAGNDAVERAKLFNDAVPINGTILTKADADSKGGAAISIAHITGKPILFLGMGQEYKDIKKFETGWFVDRLFER
ncbi:signal recognition particle-docking protein FtsY [Methanocella sp. CWC-04]|uniref:Signal recognition particle receptor FtsY n=1 Tax=Methanooceanicella nereidis TaxID=2052831 RepID=A0AAP2REZ1_9EURY|nr:signal recognition particle-docking protein FtsY [Methanocella sp. CWC-04]MCD1295325.1 signal recognition particle-docking protein FtsY [Methanocella sp. CWC-04]